MRLLAIVAAVFCCTTLSAQLNMELISQTEYATNGNDVWGFVDSDGIEYGVVGSNEASLVYDLSDPANPVLVKEVQGAVGTWRDFKHVGNYIYGVADQGADGLLVIDMTSPKDSIPHAFYKPTYNTGNGEMTLSKIHNLYADDRYVYLSGFDFNGNRNSGGVLILDTEEDALQPPIIGFVDDDYSHDVYVNGDVMYTSEIYRGEFGVYDISDRTNPVRLALQETTTDFTHNAWSSDDGQFLFTTDERANAYVESYDLSDLSEIRRLDRFQPYRPGAEKTIPHNTHWHEGYLVTSWYEDGIIVIDGHRPDNLIEVASYDTWPTASAGRFRGCWGAYPYLPSGLLLVNDINSGFYVFQPNYTRAAYLEGMVIDSLTKEPINGATIEIVSNQANQAISNQMGVFKTGQEAEGTFDVVVTHPEYSAKTVSFTISKGQVTDVIIEMPQIVKSGTVIVETSSQIAPVVEEAVIAFYNKDTGELTYSQTDEMGNFAALIDEASTYDVFAGKWGFGSDVLRDVTFDNGAAIQFKLKSDVYEDDFFGDLGWTIETTASTGAWELGIPNGSTDDQGNFAEPGVDAENDLGPAAYVTGNSGSFIGEDDLDDGETILTSPEMSFTGLDLINVNFDYWYFTCCGNGPVDDILTISVSNGIEEILLDEISASSSEWKPWSYQIQKDEIEFTDNMKIIVNASDNGIGNVVEAGIDVFRAEGIFILSNLELKEIQGLQISPNPFIDQVTISSRDLTDGKVQVFDIIGNLVAEQRINATSTVLDASLWASGVYYVRLITDNTVSQTLSVVKQ